MGLPVCVHCAGDQVQKVAVAADLSDLLNRIPFARRNKYSDIHPRVSHRKNVGVAALTEAAAFRNPHLYPGKAGYRIAGRSGWLEIMEGEPVHGSDTAVRVSKQVYETELRKLQVELCYLQDWVRETGARIVIVCEGRDTAGKGGFIKRLTERVSPRTFRVVALSAPSERERSMLYLQRYLQHFPVAGEVVIFDRSWYNRAGVDRVMGFASEREIQSFLNNVPHFEEWLVEQGFILIKLWFAVGMKEQERRFKQRIEDPLRQWKLSPMDLLSYSRWFEFSRARDAMFAATSHSAAPWYIVRSDDKMRARLNGISLVLSLIPYERIARLTVELPERSLEDRYDDEIDPANVRLAPERY